MRLRKICFRPGCCLILIEEIVFSLDKRCLLFSGLLSYCFYFARLPLTLSSGVLGIQQRRKKISSKLGLNNISIKSGKCQSVGTVEILISSMETTSANCDILKRIATMLDFMKWKQGTTFLI